MADIMNQKDYQAYEKRVAAFIADEGLSFLSTGTDELMRSDNDGGNPDQWNNRDPWFSWNKCQCCKDSSGGSRQYLFARNKANEIVTFEICEDCVYYVEYGRLDDATMLRIEA